MENNDKTKKMLDLLEKMQVKKDEDKELIEKIKEHLKNNEIPLAMKKLQVIKNRQEKAKKTKKLKNVTLLKNEEDIDFVDEEEEKPKKVKVKTGTAYMALRTGSKVLPVGIKTTKTNRVIVNIGKTLNYNEQKEKNPDKENL